MCVCVYVCIVFGTQYGTELVVKVSKLWPSGQLHLLVYVRIKFIGTQCQPHLFVYILSMTASFYSGKAEQL